MEKEKLKELSKEYCKRKEFILLLYRICEMNRVNNATHYIEKFLKQSVSKQCVKKQKMK